MRNQRRLVGAIALGAAITTATMIGAAGPAQAHTTPDQSCGDPIVSYHDDGPITDVIHHSVEPVLSSVIPNSHATNCNIRVVERAVLAYLDLLGGPF